jgi:hypothetical protein
VLTACMCHCRVRCKFVLVFKQRLVRMGQISFSKTSNVTYINVMARIVAILFTTPARAGFSGLADKKPSSAA